MQKALAYTTAEVAFVLREPVKAVKKALDEGPSKRSSFTSPARAPCVRSHGRISSTCLPSGRFGRS